jgi:hypothetical protein
MSAGMSAPDIELARRLLGIVPYRDRLPAGRLKPPVGLIPSPVRGLKEVRLLLAPDDRSLPGLNLSALAVWIRRVIGDAELADRVEAAVQAADNYVAGCLEVYELVVARLDQAERIAGPADPVG